MAERVTRYVTIIGAALMFGAVLAVTALASSPSEPDAAIFALVVGLAIGSAAGILAASLVSAAVEWMCQVLIALGERL